MITCRLCKYFFGAQSDNTISLAPRKWAICFGASFLNVSHL